jgi:hypothetical protein
MHSQRPCYLREPRLNCDQIVGSALCLIWLKAVPTLPTNVPRGIMLGLVLGKSGGIGLVSWLAVKAGLAALPEGATLRQLVGIGFTRALFISALAFADTPFEQEAQLVILIGSLLVPGVGIAILRTAKVPPWSAMLGEPGLSQKSSFRGIDLLHLGGRSAAARGSAPTTSLCLT